MRKKITHCVLALAAFTLFLLLPVRAVSYTHLAIRLTQPDMQGPFCNLQLIRGDQLFYDLYDDPDMIHEALDLITDTMIACQQALPTLNDKAGEEAHYILFGIYPVSYTHLDVYKRQA